MSNFLWFNKHTLIEKKFVFFCYFSEKALNFVYQLFDKNESVKSWSSIKEEFDFNNNLNFKWQQLIYENRLYGIHGIFPFMRVFITKLSKPRTLQAYYF